MVSESRNMRIGIFIENCGCVAHCTLGTMAKRGQVKVFQQTDEVIFWKDASDWIFKVAARTAGATGAFYRGPAEPVCPPLPSPNPPVRVLRFDALGEGRWGESFVVSLVLPLASVSARDDVFEAISFPLSPLFLK